MGRGRDGGFVVVGTCAVWMLASGFFARVRVADEFGYLFLVTQPIAAVINASDTFGALGLASVAVVLGSAVAHARTTAARFYEDESTTVLRGVFVFRRTLLPERVRNVL